MNSLPHSVLKSMKQRGPKCFIIDKEIKNLSDFEEALDYSNKTQFWFRGHSDVSWKLVPGALRFGRIDKRKIALDSFHQVQRRLQNMLPPIDSQATSLAWMQRAQHFGMPTRLLDWSETMSTGLYFACLNSKIDGAVFVIDPKSLNQLHDLNATGPINPEQEPDRVNEYVSLDGRVDRNGLPTIAISPVWNNKRIEAQDGSFTLHGEKTHHLDSSVAPSLTMVPIRKMHKKLIRRQLENCNVTEMKLFPEPEKTCRYLRRQLNLD